MVGHRRVGAGCWPRFVSQDSWLTVDCWWWLWGTAQLAYAEQVRRRLEAGSGVTTTRANNRTIIIGYHLRCLEFVLPCVCERPQPPVFLFVSPGTVCVGEERG